MIDIDLSRFEETLDMIQTMGNKSPRMMQAIVRQSGRKAQVPWRRATAKQAGVKVRRVQRATKTKNYAQGSDFLFEMRVRDQWTYLTEFGPVQTDEGIEASPWGDRQVFKGTFFAGVDYEGGSHMGVFVRKSDDRLPIRQLYGPNVAVEGSRDEAVEVFQDASEEALDGSLQQQLGSLFA